MWEQQRKNQHDAGIFSTKDGSRNDKNEKVADLVDDWSLNWS